MILGSSLDRSYLILLFMQSVEEAECQRAFDSAVQTYNSSFDHKKHIEEVELLISELLDALF
jgi:hypothetical protein